MPLEEWIGFLSSIGLSERILHAYERKLYKEADKMKGMEEITSVNGQLVPSTQAVPEPARRKLSLSDPNMFGHLSLCCAFLKLAEQTRLMVTSKPLMHVMKSDGSFWRDLCFPAGDYEFQVPVLNKYIELSNRKATSLQLGWEDPSSAEIDDDSFTSNNNALRLTDFANIERDGGIFTSLCKQNYFQNLRTLYLAQDFQWIGYSTLYMLLSQAAPKLEDLFLTLPAEFEMAALQSLIDKMVSLKCLEVCMTTYDVDRGWACS